LSDKEVVSFVIRFAKDVKEAHAKLAKSSKSAEAQAESASKG
jgi:hypothetical protein